MKLHKHLPQASRATSRQINRTDPPWKCQFYIDYVYHIYIKFLYYCQLNFMFLSWTFFMLLHPMCKSWTGKSIYICIYMWISLCLALNQLLRACPLSYFNHLLRRHAICHISQWVSENMLFVLLYSQFVWTFPLSYFTVMPRSQISGAGTIFHEKAVMGSKMPPHGYSKCFSTQSHNCLHRTTGFQF
jgi:hypothetical protein